jgi:hypothetical protein
VWIAVMASQLGPAIDVRTIFRHERDLLIQLLRKLDEPEWAADMVCPGCSVRDVAAHLLHDDLRRLSRTRDHVEGPVPEGVWWAGVEAAPVWLDVARDYTEDWIHHQQIRDPVERPGLSSPEFLDPLLDTVMRALPKSYEPLHAEDGTTVVVVLNDGSRSLSWSLAMDIDRGWTVYPGTRSSIPTAQVILPADTFWRLATGSVPRQQAVEQSRLTGDQHLAAHMSRWCPLFDEQISASIALL